MQTSVLRARGGERNWGSTASLLVADAARNTGSIIDIHHVQYDMMYWT